MDAHVFTVTAAMIHRVVSRFMKVGLPLKADSINPITAVWSSLPEHEKQYQEAVIKAVIRINNTQQQEIIYTYNKNGQLINSVVHKHEISIA
jgi:hypothetical protein